jgi:hypothetical protein
MSASDKHGPHEQVRHEQVHVSESSGWQKVPLIAAGIGVVGLGVGFALKGGDPQKFWSSYLTSLMFWLALAIGGLFFVLVQHAARAGWSIAVRRLAENMALALPVMGGLALVLVFAGSHDLYHWTHIDDPKVLEDSVLTAKRAYLNDASFHGRAIAFVAVWTVLGFFFWRWSTQQDTSADPKPLSQRMRFFAPIGIVLFAFTLTFAAFDWLMSLDPHWFSTIFGAYYFAGCVVSTHSFLAILVILLHRSGYLRGVATKEHFHDLGKYMFAFTVFWAYMAFSQYMLIWYATIPEETEWFSYRGQGDWLWYSVIFVFVRFVFPFLGLISRHIKRNPNTLMFWAVWILVAQLIDMYWLVQPALAHARGVHEISLDLYDITTFVGIGGLFIAVVTWGIAKFPLVPLKDPRLAESVNFENF